MRTLRPGFVMVPREVFGQGIFDGDILLRDLFSRLIAYARITDGEAQTSHGTTIKLKRGQLWTSHSELYSIYNAGRDATTAMRIRRKLLLLEATGQLTSQTTNHGRVITIVNFDRYSQEKKQTTSQTTSQTTPYRKGLKGKIKEKTNKKDSNSGEEILAKKKLSKTNKPVRARIEDWDNDNPLCGTFAQLSKLEAYKQAFDLPKDIAFLSSYIEGIQVLTYAELAIEAEKIYRYYVMPESRKLWPHTVRKAISSWLRKAIKQKYESGGGSGHNPNAAPILDLS